MIISLANHFEGRRTPALLVAATHGGAGKTTVTLALLRGLRERGLRVQPFKVGPDFIDPGYHAEAAGRPSINLDTELMGEGGVLSSYRHWSEAADVAVIEAMGALHDGRDGGPEGSAAEVAKLLDVPVVLVLDAWGMTRTAAAIVAGMRDFDPRLRLGGLVLNRLGGEAHAEMVRSALPAEQRRLLLGAIRRRDGLEVPERHLGLLTVEENAGAAAARAEAQRRAAAALDLDAALRLAATAGAGAAAPADAAARQATAPSPPRARLAIARDAAFCFYYEENLRLLRAAGFELAPFSPLADPALPAGADAVYLGGGYPESFAAELAANEPLAAELRRRAAAGTPVYAECGGLLYLGRSLTDFDGASHRMASLLPLRAAMDREHLSIRYLRASTALPSPLGPAGTAVRGQEFHQSRLLESEQRPCLYEAADGERHGYLRGSVAASYLHLHFATTPRLPANLLAASLAARGADPVAR